jgi:hypothetical protein
MPCYYKWHEYISGEFKEHWSINRSSNTRRIASSDPLVVCAVGQSCAKKSRIFFSSTSCWGKKVKHRFLKTVRVDTFISKQRTYDTGWRYSTTDSKFISWRKRSNNIIQFCSHSPPPFIPLHAGLYIWNLQSSYLRHNTSNFIIFHKLILPSNCRNEYQRNYHYFVAIFSNSSDA